MRVWDRQRQGAIDAFLAPRGDGRFYPENTAVALSPDGRLAAFASGGREKADALIRDVERRERVPDLPRPGALEDERLVAGLRVEAVTGGRGRLLLDLEAHADSPRAAAKRSISPRVFSSVTATRNRRPCSAS